jgi:hypothetical protein
MIRWLASLYNKNQRRDQFMAEHFPYLHATSKGHVYDGWAMDRELRLRGVAP